MDYTAMVTCRMTDEDHSLLLERAEALGMGRSEYLRTLIRIPTAPAGASTSSTTRRSRGWRWSSSAGDATTTRP